MRTTSIVLLATTMLATGAPAMAQSTGDVTPAEKEQTEAPPVGAAPVSAQEQDIVVTARKREETLLEIPVAATAVSGELIERRGLASLRDVATLTPGLNINGDAAGRAFVSIRGVGITLVESVQPGVGIFLDGIYQPNTAYLNNPLVDVQRVEVLRGPQGTLYGKNTLGGAISVITRQPGNDFEVRGGGSYAGPDNAWSTFASLSGPIVRDRLQARIAYSHRQQDGFLYNPILKADANPLNTDTVNGTIRAEPVHDVVLTINGYYDNVKGAGTPYARVAGPTDYVRQVNFNALNRQFFKYKGVNARLEFPLAALNTDVTLIGAYDGRDGRAPDNDGEFNPVDFARTSGKNELDTYTGELRFDTELSSTLTALVGLFTSKETSSAEGITSIPALNARLHDISAKKSRNHAVFGTLFWRPSEAWEVSAGLRYDRERRSLAGSTGVVGGLLAAVPGISGGHDEWSPRVTVTRNWDGRSITYASVARGFRGGGFNINPRAPFRSYEGDKVWTYEVGHKFATADRRLTLAAAAFYNDYKDLIGLNTIVGLPGGGFATIDLNSGDVRTYGVELEGTFRPVPAWTLSGGVSVQRARITDSSAFTRVTNSTLPSDRLPFQPDYNFSLNSDYVLPVGTGDITLNVGAIGKGERIAASISPTRAPVLDSYVLINGSITYRIGSFEIAAFANNLFNESYFDSYIERRTLELAVPFLPASDLGIIGDRRRYGVRTRFRF
ncbi:iron complex outermembrane receptor protein [Sphingomonas kaistensis]|uniref:Iron complex outermembrane receptor protein n=1 Tax=Sphingomonas kaistensis TaxID=298708 RepID=A0A7X5Y5Z9_9SPHN|nr:TonB-dependent receptor [Sphingomonas kaistensis]NJC05719.1 iron complex outermembrane receptor protein [Sphingomonas kaistensis]